MLFPIGFLETYQNGIFQNNQRPLDQHSVGREQLKLFFLGHGRKFGFQFHGFIEKTAGVEELFQGKAAAGMPLFQFFVSGIVLLAVTVLIG